MQNINLNLSIEEVNGILQVLGELPTRTSAYVLLMKIKQQADEQVKQEDQPQEV
jgi:hypothetical protein